MRKLILLAAAAAGVLTSGGAVARPHDRDWHGRPAVHRHDLRHRSAHHYRPHCRTEWRHHHRVRVCR